MPESKGIPEQAIEDAFVESYRILCDSNKDVLDEFLRTMNETLSSSSVNKQLSKVEKEIESLEKKKSKLVDMRLEDVIDSETYESKFSALTNKQEDMLNEREKLQETATNEKDIKRRLQEFKKLWSKMKFCMNLTDMFLKVLLKKLLWGDMMKMEILTLHNLSLYIKQDSKIA